MARKSKNQKAEHVVLMQQEEQRIEDILRFSKKRFKKFDEIIEQLYRGEDLSRYNHTDERIGKISACFSYITSYNRKLFREVLIYLDAYSNLITKEAYIQAVYNMVLFRSDWRNDIFKWQPAGNNPAKQIEELARYLFCKYPVPEFMYKAFYESTPVLSIEWFIHIGKGGRIRDLKKMPIHFTQKMAHYFLQAPSKFNIQEALRWAQVRGLGGDEKLAERVAGSWIGTKAYTQEAFWETFLLIVVNGGMFNLTKLGELIDYVRDEKRNNANYSLKGRTLSSLLRRSDEWHKQLPTRGAQLYWHSCGIAGYQFEKKNERVSIVELTTAKDLATEGMTMKHCVGSYSHMCASGKTAIFSFRKYADGVQLDTLATVEVNLLLRRIVQAKAKMNRPISAEIFKYLEQWAYRRDLTFGHYL